MNDRLDKLAEIFQRHSCLINEGVLDYDDLEELDRELEKFYNERKKAVVKSKKSL